MHIIINTCSKENTHGYYIAWYNYIYLLRQCVNYDMSVN